MRMGRFTGRKRPNRQAVRGGGTPTPTPAPVAPFLELDVGVTTYPPAYNIIDVADSFLPGDRLYLAVANNARLTSPDLMYHDLDGTEDSVGEEDVFTNSTLAGYTTGNHWAYSYLVRGAAQSSNSNTVIHGQAEDAVASWSFTNVDYDAARSAQVANGSVTPTSFNVPLPISCSPGSEYQIDAGSGFSGWTSAPGTIYPTDALDFRLTTPATYLTETSASLTIGTVTETFSVWTLADPATPQWNPNQKATPLTLSGGNLTATGAAANGYQGVLGTVSRSPSGTCSFTATYDSSVGNELFVGLAYFDIPKATGNRPLGPSGASTSGVALLIYTDGVSSGGWEIRRGAAIVESNYFDYSAPGTVFTAEMTAGSIQFKRGGVNLGSATSMPAGTGEAFAYLCLLNACASTANFGSW